MYFFFISVNQHFPAKGYFVNFCDLKLLVTIEFTEAQFLSPLIQKYNFKSLNLFLILFIILQYLIDYSKGGSA